MDSPYSHHHNNNNHHRHNQHHSHSHPKPPQLPPLTASDSQFRLLCPAEKAGGVIGKGGAVIRHLRESTGARIRIIEDFASSHCNERIILISSNPNPNFSEDSNGNVDYSVAQGALIKVFERILKVDEERGEINQDNCRSNNEDDNSVICRMLVGSNQVESVLLSGGKVLDKIREDSCAQIRVLNRDNLPSCASPGDELIQIAGNFQAVKKALLLVSSCLHEHPRSETYHEANITSQPDTFSHRSSHASDSHSRGFFTSSTSENFGPNHSMVPEEDVVFKLLCPVEKTGNLIGKGGFVVRGIQNETGATIKINESILPDSDERVVVISARESVDLRRSPAQDAVIRVHNRIAEIGFEPDAPVVARLLVPSQQIGGVIGKGGFIVNEMRRSSGAGIRIFGRDQGPKTTTFKDEVVQVTGNIQSVLDALFQITSRIRESVFPPRQHLFQGSSSAHSNTFQELPSPSFRPRHNRISPGRHHSPNGFNHGYDNRSLSQRATHTSPLSHGKERIYGANSEQDHHYYSGDRAPLPPYVPERPPSPNSWYPQAGNNGHSGRFTDAGPGVVTSNNQSTQMPMTTSVEIVVPQTLLPHVYGENRINLSHLTQLSGADVVVHDPKPGATEGRVVISGTHTQLHKAQSLVQAFIFCGQSF